MLTPEIIRTNLIESLLEGLSKPKLDPNREFDVVYRGENILLVAPRTKAAACKYGSGTRWCSANPDAPSNAWGSFERKRMENILFYLILYKDTPEGKIEDYKIAIEKKVATGSEQWNDMRGKRIFNMEMFRKFIMTDPNIEKAINDYWKANRVEWRPKFQTGDYVRPKNNYGWTSFTDKNGRGKVETSWRNVICMVVGESKSRLLIQVVRMSPEFANSTSQYDSDRKRTLQQAFDNHWVLQKWVNPYRFEKIG